MASVFDPQVVSREQGLLLDGWRLFSAMQMLGRTSALQTTRLLGAVKHTIVMRGGYEN